MRRRPAHMARRGLAPPLLLERELKRLVTGIHGLMSVAAILPVVVALAAIWALTAFTAFTAFPAFTAFSTPGIAKVWGVLLLVAMASLAASWFVASCLRRRVLDPIEAAVAWADEVVARGDYSRRMAKRSNDELGALADAFNRMMAEVERRNTVLAQREERFRLVVEAAPMATLMIDAQQRIAFGNPRAEALFGMPRDALVGLNLERLVRGPQGACAPAGPAANPLEEGTCVQRSTTFATRADGRDVPIEMELMAMSAQDQVFTLAFLVDLTERRRAQDWFQRVVEAAPNASVVIDASSRIALMNCAAERLFGHRREDLLGSNVGCLLPEGQRDEAHVAEYFAACHATDTGAGRELTGWHKSGRELQLEIGLTSLEGPQGPCTLASMTDIGERKRWANELQRSNDELEQFAYVASHDLQEPLRIVANYTELLASRYAEQLDDRAKKYIHYASDGARRMQRLLSDLLAYARIGSEGKRPRPVDVQAALQDVLEVMRRPIREAQARIVADGLPCVLADEAQLRQLLLNLLGNAVKFRAEAPPAVTIEASREGERWRFAVRDNGIGIAMAYAERVFQMFQRLHDRGRYEGSGIGLAISKRIVERHGGRIWLQSEPGQGTTFFFTLPAVPAPTP